MNRREAVQRVALLMGGTAVIGSGFFISGCKNPDAGKGILLSADDMALLDEIGETIIPTTSTPGAKSIGIGKIMDKIVGDCYTKEQQDVFVNGIATFKATCTKEHNKNFEELDATTRKTFLSKLNAEQVAQQEKKEKDKQPHYFRMMKELTCLGYFNSEVGMTKQLGYVETPGKYDGAMPYKKGDKLFV
jgi:hypothetical protein